METIKDLLCFLNELDFIEQIKSNNIEKMRCVKQRVVIEFEKNIVCKKYMF